MEFQCWAYFLTWCETCDQCPANRASFQWTPLVAAWCLLSCWRLRETLKHLIHLIADSGLDFLKFPNCCVFLGKVWWWKLRAKKVITSEERFFLFNVFVGSFAGISLALCFALDEIHDDHRWRLARRQKDGCLHFTHAVSLFPVSEYLSQSDRQKTSTGVLVRDRQWDSPGHDACCAPVACVEGLISEKTAKTLVFRIPAFLFLLCLKWPFCSHMIKMCIISSHRTMLLLFDKDSRRMPSNAIGRRFRGAHFSMQDAQICIILEQRWAQDSRWLLIWPARQVRAFSAIQPEADRNWTQLGPFGFGLFPSDSSPNVHSLCNTDVLDAGLQSCV